MLEPENKKWVIAGIQVRGPLKPISTNPVEKQREKEEGDFPTTPTAAEAKITERLPPAPRKRKSRSRCNVAREFFTPPDLETVFVRRIERA